MCEAEACAKHKELLDIIIDHYGTTAGNAADRAEELAESFAEPDRSHYLHIADHLRADPVVDLSPPANAEDPLPL